MHAQPLDEKEIFNTARKIPDLSARVKYLEVACGDDATVLERILELLRSHADDPSFLESPPPGIAVTEFRTGIEQPGSQIGPYKLLQKIGEGGMGTVYMAEQTKPVERRIALKVIKPGMDTQQVIARFEAERQALAMMDHPNIAKVFDAGATESGRPYFVMELVRGIPITRYCDEHQLTLQQRLQLFLPVCQAVQHAHQKGIIHRDLKPSNVLIAQYDDKPVPKVIDFGVAKAAQKLTERTMFTEFGQIVGTLEYMSPEQARFNQLDIDTRSDIYSLGVLLYELLTGCTPFDRKRLHMAAFDEMLRIIREEEPPRPSNRLSSVETLPAIAANRSLEPARLSHIVRGELDWIVMKALEKDRNRRYETANGLAADLKRYLDDEPVHACPPSASYRFRKFARRHRVALSVASLAIATLVVLVVGLTLSNLWVISERNAKTRALFDREQALRDAKASALLAESESKRSRKNFLAARVAIREVMTKAAIGSEEWPQLPAPLRKRFTEEAIKFYQGLYQDSADPGDRYETAIAYRSVGLLHGRGANPDLEAAHRHYRKAIEMLEQLVNEYPRVTEYRQDLAWSYYEANGVVGKKLSATEREHFYRKSTELYLALIGEVSEPAQYRARLAQCLIAWRSNHPAEPHEVEAMLHACSEELENDASQPSRSLEDMEQQASIDLQLGRIHALEQQLEKSEHAFRRAADLYAALAAKRPDRLAYRRFLRNSYAELHESLFQANKLDESTAIARRAVAVFDEALVDFKDQRQLLLQDQGHNYRHLGFRLWTARHFADARKAFENSSEFFRQCAETSVRERATCLMGRAENSAITAWLWEAEGANDEAQRSFREALARYEVLLTEGLIQDIQPDWMNQYHRQFAGVLGRIGTLEDVLRVSAKLHSPAQELNASGLYGVASCHLKIAQIFQREGQITEATESLRRAQEVMTKENPVSSSDGWVACDVNARLGQWKEAAEAVDRALELDPTNHEYWYPAAALHLAASDKQRYGRLCHEMLHRFGDTKSPLIAERTVKACLLLPHALDAADSELAQQLANRVGSSRVDLQACKLEYSIVSPK